MSDFPLIERQKEMKKRWQVIKKTNPDKWALREVEDQRILDEQFPKDNANHRRAARTT